MYKLVFPVCDDGISSFDRSTTSQRILMEQFIFGFQIAGERSGDVCQWKEVTCNCEGEVEWFTSIEDLCNETGTLQLELLPCSMRGLTMRLNALKGTIQLADLPEKMEVVDIYNSSLTGRLELDSLPERMQEVLLRHNEFTGEISLEHLPKGLNVLSLSGNQLRGTVCLTSLPVRLHSLDLSENTFLWWLTGPYTTAGSHTKH